MTIINYLNKVKTRKIKLPKKKNRKHRIKYRHDIGVVLLSLQCCQSSYLLLFPIVFFNFEGPSVYPVYFIKHLLNHKYILSPAAALLYSIGKCFFPQMTSSPRCFSLVRCHCKYLNDVPFQIS